MKITTRMEGIEGVEKAEWDGDLQKLIIYKDKDIPTETINIKANKILSDIQLQNSVRNIDFIIIPKGK